MSVKLRLQRRGAKKAPFYRIVAADTRAPRDGRFLDIVGTYDPTREPFELRLKMDRVEYWLGNGAQPSDTVASLLRQARRNPDILTPVGPSARKARPVPSAGKKTDGGQKGGGPAELAATNKGTQASSAPGPEASAVKEKGKGTGVDTTEELAEANAAQVVEAPAEAEGQEEGTVEGATPEEDKTGEL